MLTPSQLLQFSEIEWKNKINAISEIKLLKQIFTEGKSIVSTCDPTWIMYSIYFPICISFLYFVIKRGGRARINDIIFHNLLWGKRKFSSLIPLTPQLAKMKFEIPEDCENILNKIHLTSFSVINFLPSFVSWLLKRRECRSGWGRKTKLTWFMCDCFSLRKFLEM